MNILLIFTFIFLIPSCLCRKYYNYTLFRVLPLDIEDLDFVGNISKDYDLHFWRRPSVPHKPAEFIIAPENKDDFVARVHERKVFLTSIIDDVQSAFDHQTVNRYIRRRMETFNWLSFYRLDDIYSWFKDLATIYPGEVTTKKIGETCEKRDILAVHVMLRGRKKRSTVIVEGGVHAREWISISFVTYFLNQILSARNVSDPLNMIAHTYEWWFVPVLNPDGYEYTHTTDRNWRKNRKDKYGVDINRNFDAQFGTVGVSKNKNDETYCGASAFSEKESLAMSNLVREHAKRLEYYLAFHSYGQYMILPYAYEKVHRVNYNEARQLCEESSKEIAKRYNTRYTIGTAFDTVGYITSGVSGCWVKKEFKVPYVVTFELRDSGHYGFALPAEQILPTCQETLDGLRVLLEPKGQFGKLRESDHLVPDKATKNYNNMFIVCDVLLFIIARFA